MNIHDIALLLCGGAIGVILSVLFFGAIVVNMLYRVGGGFRNL